jgi:hypothetical protein
MTKDSHPDFSSISQLMALSAPLISARAQESDVIRDVSGNYFIKRYYRPGSNRLRSLITSKARREYRNLLLFQRLGIHTLNVEAFHETGFLHRRRAALVTRALPQAQDAASLLGGAAPPRGEALDDLLRQIAAIVRRLHEYGFVHNDLHLRNFLVSAGTVHLIDSPNGRRLGLLPWLFERRRVKDLALVDKAARRYISRTQRLRLFLYYAGANALQSQHKRVIRSIVSYYDWRKKPSTTS